MDVSNSLINWYIANKRNLPWRNTTDAYFIWLSEIILQQTRVVQGLAYYKAFSETYPNIFALASAHEEEIMKLWQGLGYYSRARNLHTAAKQVVDEFGGEFPSDYESIRRLKGVGDYTAAAIASFAFGLPHAVVDGNVYRVLSRVFNIETPIDSTEGKRQFKVLADGLLDSERPDLHNQAIMEFGALQCVPKNPDCSVCPLLATCAAHEKGTVPERPLKKQKTKQRDRFLLYIIPIDGTRTCIRKRNNPKDIWQNLFEFPLFEYKSKTKTEQILPAIKDLGLDCFTIKHISEEIKHVLSHQVLHARFVVVETKQFDVFEKDGCHAIDVTDLESYAVPRLIDRFLRNAREGLFPIL